MDDEGFDQFSIILDQLLNLNELSFEAISSYSRSNQYIHTTEGIKDFVSSLPSIVEFRSPSTNLLAQIVKDFIDSFKDENTKNDIKKQIFFTFYHLPSKSPSKLHIINPKIKSNFKINGYSTTVIISKSFSNAYFFRCLYDLSIYTIYEIANYIHQYWEIDSVISNKSVMVKFSSKMPLVSLLVWFAPEIDFVNNSFFNTLCKIAKKEMFSRKLPKSYNQFIENIDKYRENGEWSTYKVKMNKGENENEIIKFIKSDDVESLKRFCLKNSNDIKNNPNKSKNISSSGKLSINCYSILNSPIKAHLFNTHWLLQYSPTPLHAAAFFGSSECVEFLLSDVVDSTGIKKRDKLGLDVVDFAGVGGSAEVIMSLRQHEIDVQRAIHTSSLFHRNHLSDYIAREFGINMKDFLPEMCASNNIFAFKNPQNENINNLDILIKITARFGSFLSIRENIFNFTKSNLENALLIAAKFSNLRYIECLLSYVKMKNLSVPDEFDINAKNEDGQTALQVVVGLSNVDITRTLILSKKIYDFDFKINLNVKLPDSEQSLLHTCVLLNSIEIAKILLNCDDFDVNITDNNGATPLHYASRCVNTIGTHLVVDLSIVKDEYIRKPENYIFSYGKFINLEMFQLFVRTKRVNFNVFDNYGMAPLHYVAKSGRVDYIIDLKLNRAISFDDASSIPPSYQSYFQYVQYESSYTSNNFNNNRFYTKNEDTNLNNSNSNDSNKNSNDSENSNSNNSKEKINNPDNLDSIFSETIDINISENIDSSDLKSVSEGKAGKILISDVDFRIKSKRELKNLLHFSAENDRVTNCSALMTFVPETVSEKDINGRTPIQLACAAGCVDCVRFLLEFATPEAINSRDKWDKTALHISGSKGRTGCVRQLAQLEGIELNSRDSQGNTALALADNHLYYLTSQLLEFVNAEK